jgi:small-conductance mechanosensitive channel
MIDITWLTIIVPYVPSLIALVVTALLMIGSYRALYRILERSVTMDVINGIIQGVLVLAGGVVFVLLLPISQAARENILQFGGLILTGVVAFSSTTVIRDAAAGITLRFVSPFTRGDYLATDSLFGRITEIGFFHTEIQTEDRSLVTIMNSNLLSTNFRTIPSSGTLLETTLSIGYDVHHHEVEAALKEAAESMDLENPFVHVENIGNYAVTYRVAALLSDIENLLTARSDFRKEVLDAMHRHDIEIVSPEFTNRRDVPEAERFIPEQVESAAPVDDDVPEEFLDEAENTTEMVFEKALEAQEAEELNELLKKLEEQVAQLKESDAENVQESIEDLRSRIEAVEARRDRLEEDLSQKE